VQTIGEDMEQKVGRLGANRTFVGVFLIPFCYVVTAMFLDVAMFLITGISFPQYYVLSLLILIMIAAGVSCIPNRWWQVGVFSFFIAVQTVTTVSNLIAYNNLTEIFSFEILRSFREIIAGAGSAKYNGLWHYVIIGAIVAIFLAVVIFAAIEYRKQKAGYPRRAVIAVGSAFMFVIAGMFTDLLVLGSKPQNSFEHLLDERTSIKYFTNRTKVLYSFGSPFYYINNLMSILGMKSMASSPIATYIEMDWDGDEYYDNYPFMLDASNNVIMLMMESVEYDAVNEVLTPSLWRIKEMSTWVNGYYAIERTCFSEYASQTGSMAMGVEMWRDYPKVSVTHSLANMFRRSYQEADPGAEVSIGAFHTYEAEFYSRKNLFTKNRLGFDYIKDLSSYGVPIIPKKFSDNSDSLFFEKAKEDIAPSDGTKFFSYVLNVSTHAPHFESTHTWYENGQIVSLYEDSLDYILKEENRVVLEELYPKMKSADSSVKLAVYAYLVAVKEYDKAIKILLDHLEGDNKNGRNLLEDTALILYSDHFNYVSYNNTMKQNNGGLLTDTVEESPIGEKLPFMIYNPKDGVEREIIGFMTNNDIYKTVCHLFNVETHGNFTLGTSVLARLKFEQDPHDADSYIHEMLPWQDWPGISVGIGFYSGLFFGRCLDDEDLHFTTRNFKVYSRQFATSAAGIPPSEVTIEAFKDRLDTYASTLFKLRSYFDSNRFRKDDRTLYTMGVRHSAD